MNTDNRTAALDAIRDRQAALNRFDAMSSIESSQGYRVRQQLLKEAARADVPFLLGEVVQSVRVSEVLDLLAPELANIIGHYECEDCWYSCPQSPEGCCNDSIGTECNCGRDRKVRSILDVVQGALR